MKIVQILPGKIWGGAEQYVLDLGKALIQRGHEVRFIALDKPPVISRLRTEDIDCTFISKLSLFCTSTRQILKEAIGWAEVVHFHDINQVNLMAWAKRHSDSSAKLIATRHIARSSRMPFWRTNALQSINRLIFVSSLAKELWTKVNPSFPIARTDEIINSVASASEASRKGLREIYNIPPSTAILVFTGRVRKSKGCEVILKAVAQLCNLDFKIVFIGAPKPKDYTKKLLEQSKKLGIDDRIIFHGFCNNVKDLISDATIGLAPSIVREACPLSPLEFMQAGIPVIASNNGAQKEYIQDGVTGCLVSPRSQEELTEKIKFLLDNPELRLQMGKASKSYFDKHLSFDVFVENVLKVYSKD